MFLVSPPPRSGYRGVGGRDNAKETSYLSAEASSPSDEMGNAGSSKEVQNETRISNAVLPRESAGGSHISEEDADEYYPEVPGAESRPEAVTETQAEEEYYPAVPTFSTSPSPVSLGIDTPSTVRFSLEIAPEKQASNVRKAG
eukprot:6984544-Pyramimonas_sp.AAC.1